jgi:hypothetical protein
MRKQLCGTLCLLLLAAVFVPAGLAADSARRDRSIQPSVQLGPSSAAATEPSQIPGMLHVKFTSQAMTRFSIHQNKASGVVETGLASIDALNREIDVRSIEGRPHEVKNKDLDAKLGISRWFVLEYDSGADVDAMVERYGADSNVEAVTGVYRVQFHAVPNDPQYNLNWGHNNTGQLLNYCWGCGGHPAGVPVGTPGFDCRAQQGWDSPQGYGSAGVVIAIIDSGTDVDHPDLNVVGGWDYIDNDANPDAVTDAHGTNTAGIASALTNNATGVAGAAGTCGIMALRASNNVHISNALVYAADNGARIVSMSFGFPGFKTLADVDNSLDYAWSSDVLMFASSANDNEGNLWVPAVHQRVIAVGAASPCGERKRSSSSAAEVNPGVFTDPNGYTCDGERWWGSNWGSNVQNAADAVEFIAPTILPSTDILGAGGYDPGSYFQWFNGTSCSCPYAAGVGALVRSLHPTWTNQQVWDRLRATATDIVSVESGAGWDQKTGYGMINAAAALALPDGIPYAPAGWGDVMVPTDVSTSTFDVAPFPAVLPGDGTTYFNWQYANVGTDDMDNPNDRGYRDGVLIYNAAGGTWPPTWRFGNLNLGGTVSGGRHTIRTAIDPFDVILELNEGNNQYARQFVWTPQPISANTLVVRAAPPVGNADWTVLSASGYPAEFASDGLAFDVNSTPGYWHGIAVHAASNADNYDLALMNPTADIFTGHDNASWTGIQSLNGAGFTDIVLANANQTSGNREAWLGNQFGDGTGNNIIEHRVSPLPEYNAALGATEVVNMAQNQMLFLREFYSADAGQVLITLDVHGAAQPAVLSVYDFSFVQGTTLDAAMSAVTNASGRAQILMNLTDFAYYGISVHRDPLDGAASVSMTLKIRPPVNVYAEHRVPGEKSVYCVPDGSGLPLTQAWLWDGVVGHNPVPADGTLHVTITTAAGVAIPGFPAEDIRLAGGTLIACPQGAIADGPTDASGVTTFTTPKSVGGQIYSGYGTYTQVQVLDVPSAAITYGPSSPIDFNSADISGDLEVNLVDVSRFSTDLNAGYNYRSDFRWDGVLNLLDLSRLAMAISATCGVPKVAAKAPMVSSNLAITFDAEGTQRAATLAPHQEATAYLVLTGPAAQKGVSAWEASLRTSDNLVVTGSTLGASSVNVGQDGDYVVGLGQEMKAAAGEPLRLATFRLLVTDDRPARLFLGASSIRSSGEDLPAVVIGTESDELEAVGVVADAEGAAAARINDGDAPRIGEESTFAFRGYRLSNAPNPFNPATEIRFELPQRGRIDVRIYDVAGRLVKELGGEVLPAGPHAVRWNGTDQRETGVVSGTYYYRLFVDGKKVDSARRMTLVK